MYNKSEIMKSAWNLYRISQKWVGEHTFSWALKRAWQEAKEKISETVETIKTGLRRMHYSEYKNNYSNCETVEGSYDKRTKTIEVLTRKIKNVRNSICPYCHTYCYGDCRAH